MSVEEKSQQILDYVNDRLGAYLDDDKKFNSIQELFNTAKSFRLPSIYSNLRKESLEDLDEWKNTFISKYVAKNIINNVIEETNAFFYPKYTKNPITNIKDLSTFLNRRGFIQEFGHPPSFEYITDIDVIEAFINKIKEQYEEKKNEKKTQRKASVHKYRFNKGEAQQLLRDLHINFPEKATVRQNNASLRNWLKENGFNSSFSNENIRQFINKRSGFDEEVARLSTLADYSEDLQNEEIFNNEINRLAQPLSLLEELEIKENEAEREYNNKINALKQQLEQVKNNYSSDNATNELLVNIHTLLAYTHEDKKKAEIINILSNFFKNLTIDMTTKPMFRFETYNTEGTLQQKNIPLSIDTINKILEQLEKIIIVDEVKEDFVYEAGELPFPSIFALLRFTIIPFNVAYKYHTENNERKAYKTNGGSFFPYFLNTTNHILRKTLRRAQIITRDTENEEIKKMFDDSCFIYALKDIGVSEEILNKIRQSRFSETNIRFKSLKDIKDVCEEFNIDVSLIDYDTEAIGVNKRRILFKLGSENSIGELVIMNGHIFNNSLTRITKDNIEQHDFTHLESRYKNNSWMKDSSRCLKMEDVIKKCMSNGYFEPMTISDFNKFPMLQPQELSTETSLEFNPEFCCKNHKQLRAMKKIQKKLERKNYYAADFEASTGKNSGIGKSSENSQRYSQKHIPYFCAVRAFAKDIYRCFRGIDCAIQLLDILPNNAVVFIHNLKYDNNFIIQHFEKIEKKISKNRTIYRVDGIYKGKHITFRDSAQLINAKLAAFPEMFGLKSGQKEIFPYNYYTLDRLEKNIGIISEAGKYEDKQWNEEDYKQFESNIDNIPNCRIDKEHFDMYSYVEFYCKQDVRILAEGLLEFQKQTQCLNIDALETLTAASLANKHFTNTVYSQEDELYAYSGIVAQFIRKSIYGGRCMTRLNKKWHITKPLVDFDARSLYPSAMRICKLPLGKPQIIPDNAKYDDIKNYDCYVVEIKVKSCSKHLDFPVICKKDKKRGNIYDDFFDNEAGDNKVLNKIDLENYIEFQGLRPDIDFEIIKGLYWNNGFTTRIQDVIQDIYDKRLYYKSLKNPLEAVYKLIMNSSYGKTIQRPVSEKITIITKDDEANFVRKNYNTIKEIHYIPDSNLVEITEMKTIEDDFSYCLVGSLILAYSKRIMYEVMCLAQDLNIPIYYQDTDSMHIPRERVSELETAYKQKYGRELIGKQLGQLHSDFDSKVIDEAKKTIIKEHPEYTEQQIKEIKDSEIYAVESYFIAKKVYIDKLTCDATPGIFDYHIRMKGVSKEAVIAKAKELKCSVLDLYKKLYNGEHIKFDLTIGKPSFELTKDYEVFSRNMFIREISTNYEEGME